MPGNDTFCNDPLPFPHLFSIKFNISDHYCIMTRPSSFILTSYSVVHVLVLLPLCIFILHLGLQRRRQQGSTTAAATTTTSHSDVFTYHMVAMEMVGVSGFIICCCGIHTDCGNIVFVGYIHRFFTLYGQMLFHVLTCLERYLAVVHPTTYMTLRGDRGVRVRNISVACVWLLSFVGAGVILVKTVFLILAYSVLISSVIVTSFFSVSVLRVLIRPGPGERGGDGERVDLFKKKAFYTILVILAVLLLRFIWNLVWAFLYMSKGNSYCVRLTAGVWCNLPCSLVLPLLFLHRAEKLVFCKNT